MSNELKAVSKTDDELVVANYIILFGGDDLVGERFSKETDVNSSYIKSSVIHVDFEHGQDPDKTGMDKNEILGYVDWKTAKVDEKGIFVERVLNRRARYMEFIEPLIEDGLIGNSSEAVQGKTQKTEGGDILKWPLMRDTLTVSPCEPRMLSSNSIAAVKALNLDIKTVEPIEECKTLKNIESVLRVKHGLSRSEATAIVAAVKRVDGDHQSKNDTEETLNLLNNFTL